MHWLKPKPPVQLFGSSLMKRVKEILCASPHDFKAYVAARGGDTVLVRTLKHPVTEAQEAAHAVLLQVTSTGKVSVRPFGTEGDRTRLVGVLKTFPGMEKIHSGKVLPPSDPPWWEFLSKASLKAYNSANGTDYQHLSEKPLNPRR